VLPVKANEQLYGITVFKANRVLNVQDDTRLLMGAIRDRVAQAIERTFHLSQLVDSREETLKTLGLVLEYRDYETEGHTDRVVELALKLGQQMRLAPEEPKALEWGRTCMARARSPSRIRSC